MTRRNRLFTLILALLLVFSLFLSSCDLISTKDEDEKDPTAEGVLVPENLSINGERIPSYSGAPYYVVNEGVPFFTESEITDKGFYEFTELDSLGRCGAAWGSIGLETMPSDERESISHIKPSGWEYNGKSNNNSYDKSTGVNGTIYNRAHLLANQLVDKDVDKRNLITGTCSMNQIEMVKFENLVADYVKETGGHVMYRVTPYFEGQNLVCAGVLMEGLSVEDNGDGVTFCVFIYNVQPGIYINYLTGENHLSGEAPEPIVPPELPYDIITAPEEGKPYLLLGNYISGERYFSGEVDKGLLTTSDRALASEVFFERVEGGDGYFIYYMTGDEKLYITLAKDEPAGITAAALPSTYWIYDAQSGAFYTSRDESHDAYGKRALALDPDREDVRAYYQGQISNGTYEPLIVAVYKTDAAE